MILTLATYAAQMLDAMSASLPGESVHKVSEGSVRRAKQLSVIFYQYITSIMNSGEICPELVVLNFEIQRVSFVSVVWSDKVGLMLKRWQI